MTVLMVSTYHAFQVVICANTIALGDRRESSNPFRWERAVVKFPGPEGYDCNSSLVYKDR